MLPNEKRSIKDWAEDDRPREKLEAKGKASLSDAELLAILLGSGSANQSAVALAQDIILDVNGNLSQIGNRTITQLTKFKGVGPAKAITVIAALEFAARINKATKELELPKKITQSSDAFERIKHRFRGLQYEEVWGLFLNRANSPIREVRISEGGQDAAVIDPKKVFHLALEHHAASLILAHNHPSGNLVPSEADKKITKKLVECGQFLDIPILDHLIICQEKYISMKDESYM